MIPIRATAPTTPPTIPPIKAGFPPVSFCVEELLVGEIDEEELVVVRPLTLVKLAIELLEMLVMVGACEVVGATEWVLEAEDTTAGAEEVVGLGAALEVVCTGGLDSAEVGFGGSAEVGSGLAEGEGEGLGSAEVSFGEAEVGSSSTAAAPSAAVPAFAAGEVEDSGTAIMLEKEGM